MSKQYKLTTNIRGFAAGDTVGADQLKEAGHDADDLVKRNALEDAPASTARTDTPGIPTDEQNKINIENAIRDKTVEQGKPLSVPEQDKLAAEVTADSGRPVRTDGKDVNKAEKVQEKARAAEQKAADQAARNANR